MNYLEKVKILLKWQRATCIGRYNSTINALLLLLGNAVLSSILFVVCVPLSIILLVKEWTYDILIPPFFAGNDAFSKMKDVLDKKSHNS